MEHTNQSRPELHEHVFVLKSMFYLLSPEDTFYQKAEDVPDLIQKVALS